MPGNYPGFFCIFVTLSFSVMLGTGTATVAKRRPFVLSARIGPFRAIWRHFPVKWTNGPSGGRKARKTKIREK